MERKGLDYLVIAALLVSGLYVTVTGLVADVFGFPQIAFHAEVGYACAVLAVAHLALNWRQVTAYVRLRLGRRRRQERPEGDPPAGRAPLLSRRRFLVSGLAAAGGFLLGRLIPGRQADLPYDSADVGELYHQWSKPGASQALGVVLNWGERTEQYKTYADAVPIALPDPRGYQGLSLEEAIEARRSVRNYSGETLPAEELSRLLHAAQGITDTRRGFRAAPSAGALYPIELYAVVHDVADFEPGIYHYAVQKHALELLKAGDFRAFVMQAGLFQSFLGQANVCFVLSAIFQRTRWRYRERTYRYVMLEAGHVGQNLYLAATSMGLGACVVGAFLDDEFNDLLGLDGKEEAVLYVISVGTT
ncbi:MAG: SagB family peptide dehydrogenase [Anaerolineae bacterium]|nr:SagB family peptide dehydrogenase [Anaerolineae bacterium]